MNQSTRRLWIVDDDTRFAETLAIEFKDRGYEVSCVEDLASLRRLAGGCDGAVVDLRLRHDNGLDAVSWIHERHPDARVVVLTGYGSIATAVRAVRLGAANYLTKPVSVDDLEQALARDVDETPPEEDGEDWESPSLARHEREYIEYILAECNGNVSRAARRLGLHRQSLQRKLRKFTPRS